MDSDKGDTKCVEEPITCKGLIFDCGPKAASI